MSKSTAGSDVIFVYRWEDEGEFNQDPGAVTDSVNKNFGVNETMDTQDRSNNPERMWRPFSRAAEQIIEQEFEGSWGGDWTLSNSWWLQFFYGEPDVSESGGNYIHEYETHPRTPPKSAHIIEETHYPDGEIEQVVYTGAVSGSFDLDVSVQDLVDVSMDGVYVQDHTFHTGEGDSLPYGDDSDGIAAQPESDYRAMHFGNAELRMDLDEDGTPEFRGLVQDASFGFEGNVEPEYELGSRLMAVPSYLQFEPDMDYTSLVGADIQDEERRSAYGTQDASTQVETMESAVDGELIIDNGQDIGEQNPITFYMEGTFTEDYSRDNVGDPQEALEEDISRIVSNITAEVTSEREEPL